MLISHLFKLPTYAGYLTFEYYLDMLMVLMYLLLRRLNNILAMKVQLCPTAMMLLKEGDPGSVWCPPFMTGLVGEVLGFPEEVALIGRKCCLKLFSSGQDLTDFNPPMPMHFCKASLKFFLSSELLLTNFLCSW